MLFFILQTIQADPSKEITHYFFSILNNAENANYIGESISQLNHALQAAHHASSRKPYGQELIIAALFHDIAHQLQTILNLKGNNLGAFDH